MRAGGVVPCVALALLCACSGSPQDAGAPTPLRSEAGATSTSPAPRPAEEGTAVDPRPTQPLVVIGHVTRPRLRLTLGQARRHVARYDEVRRTSATVRAVRRGTVRTGVVPASAVDATVRAAIVDGIDPLRRPQRYPLRTDADEAVPRPVTVSIAGDVMLTRRVRDPVAALEPLAPRLRRADLAVANLESTLSRDGAPQQGGDSFGGDPSLAGILARAGFDAVSLANNHTGDFGTTALLRTVRTLQRSAVAPFGAGRDLRQAVRPAILEAGGVSFGFLGFNAIGETPRATARQPGALSVRMPPRTGPLVQADLDVVLAAVRRLARRVDVVVVLPHWGTQYTHAPEPVQRTVGRRLIDAGADLVVGGHPHWVQGWEWHRGRTLVHSLGNYVFDMDFMTETQQGVLLEAIFWGEDLKGLEPLPYRMDGDFAPRPASPREGREILDDVWGSSTGPFALR